MIGVYLSNLHTVSHKMLAAAGVLGRKNALNWLNRRSAGRPARPVGPDAAPRRARSGSSGRHRCGALHEDSPGAKRRA